jgi:hypothetical protein
MCVFTEKIGKQHIGYAVCLLQNIARSFSEFAKFSSAELADIDVKVRVCALLHVSIIPNRFLMCRYNLCLKNY